MDDMSDIRTVVDRPLRRIRRYQSGVKSVDLEAATKMLSDVMKTLIDAEANTRTASEDLNDMQYATDPVLQSDLLDASRLVKAMKQLDEACKCVRAAQECVSAAKECLRGGKDAPAIAADEIILE